MAGCGAGLAALALVGCGARAANPGPARGVVAAVAASGSTCAPMPSDLAAPGPYAVATLQRTVTGTTGTTSTTTQDAARRLDVAIWYPANTQTTCAFPVILFSDGYQSRPEEYAGLLAHLASEGFVVVAPRHDDAQQSGLPLLGAVTRRLADVKVALSGLPALNGEEGSPLRGRLDTRHVGIAGHSLGGLTAVLAGRDVPGLAAGAVMAPAWIGGDTPMTGMRSPMLIMVGDADMRLFTTGARELYDALPGGEPHGLLTLRGEGHGAFSDGCAEATRATVNRYLAAFFLTYLAGERPAGAALDPAHVAGPNLTLVTTDMP